MKSHRLFPLAVLMAGAVTPLLAAPALSVAAAANLVYALDELNAAFRREAPEVVLTATTGASGSLVAQIGHGAPFDVFLSADLDYPQALIKAGNAVPESLTTFAVGRHVLWTTRPGADISSLAAAGGSSRHPHPFTAPTSRIEHRFTGSRPT